MEPNQLIFSTKLPTTHNRVDVSDQCYPHTTERNKPNLNSCVRTNSKGMIGLKLRTKKHKKRVSHILK